MGRPQHSQPWQSSSNVAHIMQDGHNNPPGLHTLRNAVCPLLMCSQDQVGGTDTSFRKSATQSGSRSAASPDPNNAAIVMLLLSAGNPGNSTGGIEIVGFPHVPAQRSPPPGRCAQGGNDLRDRHRHSGHRVHTGCGACSFTAGPVPCGFLCRSFSAMPRYRHAPGPSRARRSLRWARLADCLDPSTIPKCEFRDGMWRGPVRPEDLVRRLRATPSS